MLERIPVTHAAARKIQAMILGGELKPGEKMPSQRDFSARLKVSRASLREALLTLETLGLLKTEPGRGTFVALHKPSRARNMARWRYADSYPVSDVFQTRSMLESRIISLSALSLSAEQLDSLDRATDTMEQHWEAGDLLSNVESDLEFHGIIVAACPNRMLVDLYHSVRELVTETQIQPIPMTDPERMHASIGEHRLIVAALRERNSAKAASEMQNHIRNTALCAGVDLR